MGGCPGIVPGQIALGQSSALAGAPSMTGGILSIDSSSLGNLKPASLNALPKSFNFGKSIWQVMQEVPYNRANAGMALPFRGSKPAQNARARSAGRVFSSALTNNDPPGFKLAFSLEYCWPEKTLPEHLFSDSCSKHIRFGPLIESN